MEWSRSPSRSREPLRRRRAAPPPLRFRDAAQETVGRRFRLMVVLSCGLHVAVFLFALGADSLHRRKLVEEKVAVVDLVGLPGPAEEPAASSPAREEGPVPPPPAAKAPEETPPSKAPKPSVEPKAPREAKSAPTPKSAPAAAPSPKGVAATTARTSPEGLLPPARPAAVEKKPEKAPPVDARSAEEAIRAMRERRDESARVRDIVAKRRLESAAASAIVGVRQRARRQVDLTSVRAGAARNGASSGGGSGSAGNVRATMEQVIYFRALRDRIRSKWIAPPGDTSSLTVKMVVTIEKDGSVSNTVVEKGSGNRLFDDSVQRAIGKASPLPVPPEQLRGGEECYSVGFNFKVGEE